MPFEKTEKAEKESRSDRIVGRNAVHEALKAEREIDSVWVARGERGGTLPMLLALCRDRGIPIKEVDIAFAACKAYATIDELFQNAAAHGAPPFFILCDELEDPHNLGAILRTAEAAGAHGVIIPKRRAVGLTDTVYKASAGAVEYVPVARVTNLTDTVKELKKRGVWVYGLDMDGETWCKADLAGAVCVVVGSEGRGIGRLLREQCDQILSLPMSGSINSLNASVACGIVLYEVARQRAGIAAKN